MRLHRNAAHDDVVDLVGIERREDALSVKRLVGHPPAHVDLPQRSARK